jgi:hypothetical protein
VFFVGDLLVQAAYPIVPWFVGGDMAFLAHVFRLVESDAALSVRALRGGGRPRVTNWPVN